MVETVEHFKLHPTFMSYTLKVFKHLQLNKQIYYLINYCKSYLAQFGQTKVFLIAVYEHSKAATGRLENWSFLLVSV